MITSPTKHRIIYEWSASSNDHSSATKRQSIAILVSKSGERLLLLVLITPVRMLEINSDYSTHTRCGVDHDDRLREGFDLMRAAWA